jgi:hypothetical protein
MATITAKELANRLDTDPRTVRKFLRDNAKAQGGEVGKDTPGKGKRYAIEAREVASLKKGFAAWVEAKASPEEEVLEDNEVLEDEVEGDDLA